MLRRTKIVATLGPATDAPGVLEDVIRRGADVVRLNFSHGIRADQVKRVEAVRAASERVGKHVAVLGDLQGPKIRIERFAEGRVVLNEGEPFALDPGIEAHEGTARGVGISYDELARDVRPGDELILGDGQVELVVLEVRGARVEARVTVGGEVSDHKGINRRGGGLSAKALTDKDREDVRTAAELEMDYLAVSFVRQAADVEEARTLLRAAGSNAGVVAKIERSEAIPRLDEICRASDAIMVARGDLGVEMGYAQLTGLQKKILQTARAHDRVTITATQMMESMIHSPVPTRAEVSDVANAVLDGSDAVMLSGETAVGKYPARAIEAMAEVIEGAETYQLRKVPRARPVRGHDRNHRSCNRARRDVHRQPHGRRGDRRADRVRVDTALDVAHPLRYPDLRVYAARAHTAADRAVPRCLSRPVRARAGQLRRSLPRDRARARRARLRQARRPDHPDDG